MSSVLEAGSRAARRTCMPLDCTRRVAPVREGVLQLDAPLPLHLRRPPRRRTRRLAPDWQSRRARGRGARRHFRGSCRRGRRHSREGLVVRGRRLRQGARYEALSGARHRLPRRQRRDHRTARRTDQFPFDQHLRPGRGPATASSSICALAPLAAIIGASYGGMVALAFAERYPQLVGRMRRDQCRGSIASDGDRMAQRAARDGALRSRRMATGRKDCGSRARWRWRRIAVPKNSPRASAVQPSRIDGRFQFPVESYLLARGDAYAATYVPEAFVCLSESIDLHRVDAARIRVPVTLVAIRRRSARADRRSAVAASSASAVPAELVELSSLYGHDAFLKEGAALRTGLRARARRAGEVRP